MYTVNEISAQWCWNVLDAILLVWISLDWIDWSTTPW